MGQDHPDHADVDTQRQGASTLICPFATVPDQLGRSRWPTFSFPGSRFRDASAATLARDEVVSLQSRYRL